MFLSSPTVVGGRVYAASCVVDPSRNYGALFCLDADTGKPIWQVSAVEGEDLKGFFSSPAVTADGRHLVIGQGLHDDRDSSLICLHAATGNLHWRVKTPLHIEGSPAVWGDVAVAGAGAVEGRDGKPVGDPGFVFAVRISDGKELWRYPVNDPESSPVIAPDGLIYIGSGVNGNAVVALRLGSDAELQQKKQARVAWSAPTPYPATGAITLAGDLVLAGMGTGNYVFAGSNPAGAVIALDRHTGQVRWQTRLSDSVLGAVAVRDGAAICPVRNGEVVALDLADGKVRWRQRANGNAPVLAGPAFTGKHVYAVSRDGFLVVLGAQDGRRVERHLLNAGDRPGDLGLSISSPTIAGGKLYVGSETGGILCFAVTRTD